jgi:hypothetical protein
VTTVPGLLWHCHPACQPPHDRNTHRVLTAAWRSSASNRWIIDLKALAGTPDLLSACSVAFTIHDSDHWNSGVPPRSNPECGWSVDSYLTPETAPHALRYFNAARCVFWEHPTGVQAGSGPVDEHRP